MGRSIALPELEKRIEALPKGPGVYILKDGEGVPIYIGKAKDLRKRMRSYLKGEDQRYTVRFLMERVADVECIITDTEKEALILEDTLIKRHKPRYNINLRDDKTYVSLRIDTREPFPRITVVRRVKRDGARYFGPYSSAQAVRETLRVLQEVFPLRTCSDTEFRNRKRPCIDYEMGRCLAPCVGLIDERAYRDLVKGVLLFLEGKRPDVVEGLRKRMEEAAEALDFEEAARLRDTIRAIELTIEKQVVARYTGKDQDVVAIYEGEGEVLLNLLFVRRGRLIGSRDYLFPEKGLPIQETLSSFLSQFYQRGRFIPHEVILPFPLEDQEGLEELLKELKGEVVRIVVPKRGDRYRLLKMAEENAAVVYRMKREKRVEMDQILEEVKGRLRLRRVPWRIEAVDISNISGDLAVGSIVAFYRGEPDKDGYRRYRIKGVVGMDDYSMMREVVWRRFRRIKEEGGGPDLLLVDGGKGQLAIAEGVVKELGIEVDLAAIAKGKGREADRFYIPGRKNPVVFKKDSPAYLLLQRIRDEAHRFAIAYHKRLRASRISSALEEIPGVGQKRKEALLSHFKGLEEIKRASVEDLCRVPSIDRRTAMSIYRAFHDEGVD